MNFKKTLIFLIIFLALGGYYYVVEVRIAGQKKTAEEAEKQLFSVTQNEIDQVTLIRPDENIVLTKQEDGWRLTEPVDSLADTAAVTGILTGVLNAERQRTIAEQPEDVEEFGLGTPGLVVMLTRKAQEQPLRLILGDETPTQSGCYAKVGDSEAVLLVETSVKTAVDKTVYDVRDKTILNFDPAQAQQATFSLNTAEVELRQENNEWRITAPGEFKADTTLINSLLSAIKSGTIQEFIAETPENIEQYGLDAPERRLTLLVGEEQSQKTLLLGKHDPEKNGIYAQHTADGNIFLIPETAIADFPTSLTDLRDKTLLAFSNDDVEKIELTTPKESIIAVQESSNQWKIIQPGEFQADSAKIRRLLSNIRESKAIEFLSDASQDLGVYGLDAPEFQISVWERETETPQTLLVGKTNDGQDGRYAKLDGRDEVALVASSVSEQLSATAFDLRYKKVLSFEREAVTKIWLQYAEETLIFQKDDNSWRSTEPEEQDLQVYQVNNLLYDLERLEFTSEPLHDIEDFSPYGLTAPYVTVTLLTENDEQAVSALFGKPPEAEEQVFAKTEAQSTIYPIEPVFLDELPRTLADVTE